MNEITWVELGRTWNKAIIKILMVLPGAILDKEDKPKHKDTIIKIIPFLIMVLSAASITNLSHRAYSHHEDWSSFLVGAGLAALVPVAVFVAIKIDGFNYKVGVWIIASIFAIMSALIQYQVYIPSNPRLDQILEAIAFGGGVPLAECLLAAMEAFLLGQVQNHTRADEQAELDRQRALEEAEHQRQQQIVKDEFERRKQEIDLQNYAIQLAQDAELKRLEMDAKLAAERLILQSRLDSKSVRKVSEKKEGPDTDTPKRTPKTKRPTGEEKLFDILNREKSGDLPKQKREDLYGQLGLTRTRMYELIKQWSSQQETISVDIPQPSIHVNGNGIKAH